MIILIMIFLHIVDDYYLQGILAQMKQKQFWKENAPDELYKDDYICALITHSFSWTFMIMLPILITMGTTNIPFSIVFVCNMIVHGATDHLKANVRVINLCQDQLIHLSQIITTVYILT